MIVATLGFIIITIYCLYYYWQFILKKISFKKVGIALSKFSKEIINKIKIPHFDLKVFFKAKTPIDVLINLLVVISIAGALLINIIRVFYNFLRIILCVFLRNKNKSDLGYTILTSFCALSMLFISIEEQPKFNTLGTWSLVIHSFFAIGVFVSLFIILRLLIYPVSHFKPLIFALYNLALGCSLLFLFVFASLIPFEKMKNQGIESIPLLELVLCIIVIFFILILLKDIVEVGSMAITAIGGTFMFLLLLFFITVVILRQENRQRFATALTLGTLHKKV